MSKPIYGKVSAALAIATIAAVVGFSWSRSLSQSNEPSTASKSMLIAEPSRTLKGHSAWVYAIAISPDGKTLASGSYNGTIKIWNLQRGELLHTINGHTDAVESLAISSNGQILASGSWITGLSCGIWQPAPLSALSQGIQTMLSRSPLAQMGKL